MVRIRADAADTGSNTAHLFHRATNAKPLEASQFRRLKIGVGETAVIVDKKMYFPMPFETGNRVD